MFKYFLILISCVFLTGCGHNMFGLQTGKYMNIGYDPNTSKMGIQYINGANIAILNRENTKLTIQMKDTLDAQGKKTQTISKIIYQIKDQKNGYNK